MKTREEVTKQVQAILQEHCFVRDRFESDIPDSASLIDDLDIDSLDRVEMVMEIEKEIKISIPDYAIEGLKTFGDVITVVHNLENDKYLDSIM